MKKLLIFGGAIVVLFVAIIALTNMSNSNKLKDNPYGTNELNQATIDLLSDKNYQNIILPDDLANQITSGEPTVAYLFSPLCLHCKNYTPKLMPLAEEYGVTVNQLNVLEYDEAWDTYGITATPTLLYFENGKAVAQLVGDAAEAETRQFLEQVQTN
ncbi:MAG: thioredoxin family protein [Solibacillus sp.]